MTNYFAVVYGWVNMYPVRQRKEDTTARQDVCMSLATTNIQNSAVPMIAMCAAIKATLYLSVRSQD